MAGGRALIFADDGTADARNHPPLSYRRCYHIRMARREKRSVSLPAELAAAIDQAAADDGTTFSAWLADIAAQRLRLEAGRRAIAEWERDHGLLTPEELADGLARARRLLGRPKTKQPTRQPSRRSA